MILQGSYIMLFLGEQAGSETNPTSVAYATNHSLQIQQSTRDIQHKDINAGFGRWAARSWGELSWSTTSENYVGNLIPASGDSETNIPDAAGMKRAGHSYTSLYKLMVDRKPVYCVFGETKEISEYFSNNFISVPESGWSPNSTNYFSGWGYITDLQTNAPVGDYETMSITITGAGPLILNGFDPKTGEGGTEWLSNDGKDTPVIPVPTTNTTTKKTAVKE